MTVEEHLKFWGNLKGLNKFQINEAIEFAVSKTAITDVYYRFIGELSKGYRQRIGLAQAILSKPDILLLDEPTEGLDPNQRQEIQTLLNELKTDRTLIISSHVLSEISKLASRIVIINKGKVVGDNTPKNLIKRNDQKQVLEVELTGKGVVSGLKKLSEVESIEKLTVNTYRLTSNGKKDIRPLLFKLAESEHWTLLGLKQVERQLDDVFSELTRE